MMFKVIASFPLKALKGKIFFHPQRTNLDVELFHARAFSSRGFLRSRGKYFQRLFLQLRLPLRDLVRMHVELFGQFRQRPLAINQCDRHARFPCLMSSSVHHWSRIFTYSRVLFLMGYFSESDEGSSR